MAFWGEQFASHAFPFYLFVRSLKIVFLFRSLCLKISINYTIIQASISILLSPCNIGVFFIFVCISCYGQGFFFFLEFLVYFFSLICTGFSGIEVKPGKPVIHSCEKSRGRLRISQVLLLDKRKGKSDLKFYVMWM